MPLGWADQEGRSTAKTPFTDRENIFFGGFAGELTRFRPFFTTALCDPVITLNHGATGTRTTNGIH